MMNRVTGMLLGAVCVAITPGLNWAQEKNADALKAEVLALSGRIELRNAEMRDARARGSRLPKLGCLRVAHC